MYLREKGSMEDGLVSVIVPIYNVENYIERCVMSICQQTYSNIEIILVDDGSTDNSGRIIEKCAESDIRIKVIHKENGGLSDARNAGIDICNGSYLLFVDGDDFIHSDMIKVLKQNMDSTNCDISVCSFWWIQENEQIETEYVNECSVYRDENVLLQLYENNLETVVAWNKLYKRKIFSNLRYPIGRLHEDEYIIHHILNEANVICYSLAKLYYYMKHENSIVSKYSARRFRDVSNAFQERVEFFHKKQCNVLEFHAKKMYMLYVLNNIDRVFPNEITKREYIRILGRMFFYFTDRKYRKFLDNNTEKDMQVFLKKRICERL